MTKQQLKVLIKNGSNTAFFTSEVVMVTQEHALFQIELEPIRHLIYDEMVTRLNMSESFTTAHADTMRTVLDYIEDRYFAHICQHFFFCM